MSTNGDYTLVQLGVWTVAVKKRSFIPGWLTSLLRWKDGNNDYDLKKKQSTTVVHTIEYLWTFMKEVYSLGPLYFILEILMNVWKVASGVLELYCTSCLLGSISKCLESRQLEPRPIIEALAGKVLLTVTREVVSKVETLYGAVLHERIKYHFMQKTMHSVLSSDILTAEDPEVKSKIESDVLDLTKQDFKLCLAFRDLLRTATDFMKILSELSLMFTLFRNSSAFAFRMSLLLSFANPIVITMRGSLFSRSFVAFCDSAHFSRMASLHNLAFNEKFREDRVTNNLGFYVEKEFEESRRLLGDAITENVYTQWGQNRSIFSELLSALTWECSIILFTLRMLWDFSSVSLDELILVQQTSQSVHSSLYRLFYNVKTISRHLLSIRNAYDLEKIENKIKDGDTPYPLYSEGRNHSGAEIEFRNVSFKYPGTDKNALTNVSFSIKPGQLVVIVGVNGSGKSSAIKLLTRLYDPSAGEILLDGSPLPTYRLADIRRATAILRQDHPVLPLSLRENVAIGLPERSSVAVEDVEDAIHQGGAEKIVQKLKQGSETVLNPINTVTTRFLGEKVPSMKAIIDEKEITTELSGGETQRISASRTFMRLMGGNIRLLVADEPTSALDPEGEYELFRRLRDHSGGKTVIFITHRFGHLTKYADLILCLKDSCLVEQGTHEELMDADGEYKKLYHLQAKAFVEE